MAKPLPKPAIVIAAPHWRPFRLDAEDALLEERVEPDGIRAIDRWLVHLDRQKAPVVTSGAVLSFFGDSTSPGPIARLLGALIAVRPTCPHIPAISEAHLLRQQSTSRPGPFAPGPGRRRCRSSATSCRPTGSRRSPPWRRASIAAAARRRRRSRRPSS